MHFSDIHVHALYGVDDGAKTEQDMRRIADASYADGVRYLCLTPHFHPGYYGDNRAKSQEAFAQLKSYVSAQYPDMQLALGNELHYDIRCLAWLTEGFCRTVNGTGYVLIDFTDGEKKQTIDKALNSILNAGYTPILAHAERYRELHGDLMLLQKWRENGVLIQLDTESLFGGFGFRVTRFCKQILSHRLADFVSSDAHDLTRRPPGMKKAYAYIAKKYGEGYAASCCYENAKELLFASSDRKDTDN